LSQPPCACSGMATASKRAMLRNFRAGFFIDGLRGELLVLGISLRTVLAVAITTRVVFTSSCSNVSNQYLQ
jgi:hypothetical protein